MYFYDSIPRIKLPLVLLWALLSLLGAVALAHVTGVINPHEKVNGLWLVVAAIAEKGLLLILYAEQGLLDRFLYSR